MGYADGVSTNPFQAPKASLDVPPVQVSGLGGWLALLGVGLFLSPLKLAAFMFTTFVPIFRNGTWDALTTTGHSLYRPGWGPLLIGEIAVNCLFILAAIVLLVLYFRKSWRFPKLCIAYFLANLVFIVGDAFATGFVVPGVATFDPATLQQLGTTLVGALIWIPYLLVSRRVKNTFVRHAAGPDAEMAAVAQP
jgi:hypothetical protein